MVDVGGWMVDGACRQAGMFDVGCLSTAYCLLLLPLLPVHRHCLLPLPIAHCFNPSSSSGLRRTRWFWLIPRPLGRNSGERIDDTPSALRGVVHYFLLISSDSEICTPPLVVLVICSMTAAT